MTEKNYESTLKRIYPKEPAQFISTGKEAFNTLIKYGREVDENRLTEAAAREKVSNQFPMIDNGNTDWLNSPGRIFLRRKAKSNGRAPQ